MKVIMLSSDELLDALGIDEGPLRDMMRLGTRTPEGVRDLAARLMSTGRGGSPDQVANKLSFYAGVTSPVLDDYAALLVAAEALYNETLLISGTYDDHDPTQANRMRARAFAATRAYRKAVDPEEPE